MKHPLLFCTLLLSTFLVSAVAAEVSPRPNILYFYVDDMGWGSIGPNGQSARAAKNMPRVQTPNLDRLAAEGINFTRGYGCTVCSPARSSLQTGFHQGHTFADRNDPNNAKKAIRADDPSIGKSLAAVGYATGYWGKWGYGGSKDQATPVIENVQTLPTSHGYRHVLAELHHVRAHTFFQPTLWSAPAASDSVGGLELIRNSMAPYQANDRWPQQPALQDHADYPSTAYCDDAYAFAALDFVRRQGQIYNQTGQPFHGLLAVQIPHAPFGEVATLPKWDKRYAEDPRFEALADQTRQWAAMVTRIDAHFGNILAALEDPNHDGDLSDSIADNTLVIFQSDNGGPGGPSHRELDTNGGLSGTKGGIQEGGIRVPLVMRWPAKINAKSTLRAGTHSDRVIDVTDMLPTFCELAGAPVPLGIDGVSIAPTLLCIGNQRPREFIIHEAGNSQSIIRDNDKLVRSKKTPLKLYDLANDHAESTDIAADHPHLVHELETLLLGERVAEPKGFANTYHQWTGNDGATTSDPDNWSDYRYSNAGITYIEDRGAPQLSWIAKIKNSGSVSNTAYATSDLEVLGLEVRGNADRSVSQTLVLGPGINLTGRNEIRLSPRGVLSVDGGEVSSNRWIEIHSGAALQGHGKLSATIYNRGTVSNLGTSDPALVVSGDFHQMTNGKVHLTITGNEQTPLQIAGKANLDGVIQIEIGDGFQLNPGSLLTVLSAESVTGRFSNSDKLLVTEAGQRFRIVYTQSRVSLLMQ